ncbi:MAG TPA: hypothetical protein VK601_27920 [Kofleriaceae bacterium]|nr:hypothetical protein [Kofleriaceae bacterium]
MNTQELVTALEALALGEPWAEPLRAAGTAIAEDRAAAEATMFPSELTPTTADAIAAYTWHTARLAAPAYGERLADLHRRAMATHPALAELMRSVDALDDVGAAAASLANADRGETHAAAGARAAAAARRRYQRDVADQLAEAPGHELAASARALLAVENLEARVAAESARREEHAAAELARELESRRAADRAVIDRSAQRVREAETRAADARAAAAMTAAEYRKLRAEAFIQRLKLSDLKHVRVGGDGALYAIADLVETAGEMSIEQLARFEAALAAREFAR